MNAALPDPAEPTAVAFTAEGAAYQPGEHGGTGASGPGPQAWQPAPPGPPRRRRWPLVAAVVALVVVVGGLAGTWQVLRDRPAPQARAAAPAPATHRPTSTTPAHPAAYQVGTCLTEQGATGSRLTPVPCTGAQAVLVIDKVVALPDDCNAIADYPHHGSELFDRDARAAYCLSLVVPAQQCFEFSNDNSSPFQRVACGSSPDAVQVQALDSAPNAETACAAQTAPDIWFYSSPTSGQYACVSRPQS